MKFAPVVFMALVVMFVPLAVTADVCATRLIAPNKGTAAHRISIAAIREISFIHMYLSLAQNGVSEGHSLVVPAGLKIDEGSLQHLLHEYTSPLEVLEAAFKRPSLIGLG